jgi:hypothetical protein
VPLLARLPARRRRVLPAMLITISVAAISKLPAGLAFWPMPLRLALAMVGLLPGVVGHALASCWAGFGRLSEIANGTRNEPPTT